MKVNVLIISESVFRRNLLSEMLSNHKIIKVVDIARNEQETIKIIENEHLNVVILDVEYENKKWIRSFNLLIKKYNIHTIVLTNIDPKTNDSNEISLILNSYDYIVKPRGIWKDVLPEIRENLISKILRAKNLKLHNTASKTMGRNKIISIQYKQKIGGEIENQSKIIANSSNEYRAEEYFLDLTPISITELHSKVIVIGASVGGPRTLRTILSDIPRSFDTPILVVQHLNHFFMRQFAVSLKDVCKINVKIGLNYEEIKAGTVYFSPGDKHMQVVVKNNKPCIRTFEGEPVNYCRPSVDVLFFSTARVYKEKTLGILLTGMGSDGVTGLKAIKSYGGKTIAESKETSILYGMPRVAAETGAADLIIPNYQVVDEMIKFAS